MTIAVSGEIRVSIVIYTCIFVEAKSGVSSAAYDHVEQESTVHLALDSCSWRRTGCNVFTRKR